MQNSRITLIFFDSRACTHGTLDGKVLQVYEVIARYVIKASFSDHLDNLAT